jgi:hypothetical protein
LILAKCSSSYASLCNQLHFTALGPHDFEHDRRLIQFPVHWFPEKSTKTELETLRLDTDDDIGSSRISRPQSHLSKPSPSREQDVTEQDVTDNAMPMADSPNNTVIPNESSPAYEGQVGSRELPGTVHSVSQQQSTEPSGNSEGCIVGDTEDHGGPSVERQEVKQEQPSSSHDIPKSRSGHVDDSSAGLGITPCLPQPVPSHTNSKRPSQVSVSCSAEPGSTSQSPPDRDPASKRQKTRHVGVAASDGSSVPREVGDDEAMIDSGSPGPHFGDDGDNPMTSLVSSPLPSTLLEQFQHEASTGPAVCESQVGREGHPDTCQTTSPPPDFNRHGKEQGEGHRVQSPPSHAHGPTVGFPGSPQSVEPSAQCQSSQSRSIPTSNGSSQPSPSLSEILNPLPERGGSVQTRTSASLTPRSTGESDQWQTPHATNPSGGSEPDGQGRLTRSSSPTPLEIGPHTIMAVPGQDIGTQETSQSSSSFNPSHYNLSAESSSQAEVAVVDEARSGPSSKSLTEKRQAVDQDDRSTYHHEERESESDSNTRMPYTAHEANNKFPIANRTPVSSGLRHNLENQTHEEWKNMASYANLGQSVDDPISRSTSILPIYPSGDESAGRHAGMRPGIPDVQHATPAAINWFGAGQSYQHQQDQQSGDGSTSFVPQVNTYYPHATPVLDNNPVYSVQDSSRGNNFYPGVSTSYSSQLDDHTQGKSAEIDLVTTC